ncbi:preprotein translocase subunit YajC [Chitinophaga pendula]|uniref:preprotein translocase subunit YajC n=1 Tax=Chitinophaga TaxID=79328 RepID=UPI000BAEEBC6|nr:MULTISPECIES: preprotein translocase subunit YajC [Chitinophaga]ASZ15106.1 preprotein translocase subunit YajC [Chitinophaga sp. MD30]UCJ08365.1 preprotein translocase subunit YajC [Chitinophaga pendula]
MLNVLLMGGPQGAGGGASSMGSLLFFAGMILVMWLFMIRPQTKKAKLQKQFIDNLREGDKIVTIAGIHGKVKKINENNTIQMEVSPGTFFTIERSAVSMEYTQAQQKAAEAKA